MKKIIHFLAILFCLITMVCYSNKSENNNILSKDQSPSQISLNIPDSLHIVSSGNKNESNRVLEQSMPWIIALIIGVFSAFINFWIANRQRISNEGNLKAQIESNEKNLKLQIDTNKETKILEYKAMLAVKNRQDWLNDVRQTLAEYISSTSLILPPVVNPTQQFLDERIGYIQRMALSKAKLELLLNKDRPEQAILLEKIELLLNISINATKENYLEEMKLARAEIVFAAKELFVIHWQKIKELG